jgi:hypothetical protein
MLAENPYHLSGGAQDQPAGNEKQPQQQQNDYQDDDAGSADIQGYSSRRPLVLGSSPEIRSSSLVAISKALPSALNRASALWWSLVPYRMLTCRLSLA